jgi:thioredoxin reductase (NADPH)
MAGSMDTGDRALTPFAVTVSRPDRVFPTLTPEQLSRIASHGRRRSTIRGDVLIEVGDRAVPVFVVISGELQALRPSATGDMLIVSHRPGQFSGEASIISGRRALGRLRVSEAGRDRSP